MTQTPAFEANRRRFLGATATAFAALTASGCMTRGAPAASAAARPSAKASGFAGYGALVPDPAGLLDLPEGFSYRVISRLGDAMDDGGTVPDRADGMGCFDLGNGEIALVRNHELQPRHDAGGPIAKGFGKKNGVFVPGGTWVRDPCHPLPQEEICSRLSDRRYDILRRYGSAMPSERRALDLEQRGIDARLAVAGIAPGFEPFAIRQA